MLTLLFEVLAIFLSFLYFFFREINLFVKRAARISRVETMSTNFIN